MMLPSDVFKSKMFFALITFSLFVMLVYFASSSKYIQLSKKTTTLSSQVIDSRPKAALESAHPKTLSAIVGNSEEHLIPYKKSKPPVTIIYRDLSNCPRPRYLTEYTARCWGKCDVDKVCHKPVTNTDITKGKAKLRCFEDFHLIGVRKCGSTDLSHWFLKTKDLLNKFGQRGHRSGVSKKQNAEYILE
jgi:hypothetical protein